MTGPVVLLLVCLAAVPTFLLILRIDAWMTEREYQRHIRGDQSDDFQAARDALRKQIEADPQHLRLGQKTRGTDD